LKTSSENEIGATTPQAVAKRLSHQKNYIHFQLVSDAWEHDELRQTGTMGRIGDFTISPYAYRRPPT
jgi:hypothetical protein